SACPLHKRHHHSCIHHFSPFFLYSFCLRQSFPYHRNTAGMTPAAHISSLPQTHRLVNPCMANHDSEGFSRLLSKLSYLILIPGVFFNGTDHHIVAAVSHLYMD